MILDAAEGIFADCGFEATRVQTIADAAEVSIGTIYGVFGSKAELFSAVLTRRFDGVAARAASASLGATNALEKLTQGLDGFIAFLLEHPDFLRIHLREHPWGMDPLRVSNEQLTSWREGLDLLIRVLQQAISEGLVVDEDPELLARSIVAVHQVHLADWVDKGMSTAPEEIVSRLHRLFRLMFAADRGE